MDYGSGCESGWTVYLENSFIPPCTISHKSDEFHVQREKGEYEEEEEEDLSMVSDASSGPQQNLGEEDYGLCYHAPVDAAALFLPANKISNVKLQKKKESRLGKLKEKASALDDTASSPIFTCTNNNYSIKINQSSAENVITDFSQGHSTTQFHGQPAHQEHTDLFQCSLLPANQLQPNQWFEERRWGY